MRRGTASWTVFVEGAHQRSAPSLRIAGTTGNGQEKSGLLIAMTTLDRNAP
jgi:hypothetical protein